MALRHKTPRAYISLEGLSFHSITQSDFASQFNGSLDGNRTLPTRLRSIRNQDSPRAEAVRNSVGAYEKYWIRSGLINLRLKLIDAVGFRFPLRFKTAGRYHPDV
jgi:hypothetical protein